jgi:catechol 2,3-dioxygenase-like lactoylglutathione lyase family enzyme
MQAKKLVPILNVSSIRESFTWFEKLGWQKGWQWGEPPTFGGVHSGEHEIYLCENGQGGRGKGSNTATFGNQGEEKLDQGAWLAFLVDDADAAHRHYLDQGLEVTWPPTDMPWGIRELHVRHPDGHVFRIGHHLEED